MTVGMRRYRSFTVFISCCLLVFSALMRITTADDGGNYENSRKSTLETLSRINKILGAKSSDDSEPAASEREESGSTAVETGGGELTKTLKSVLELGLMHYDLENYDEAESQFRKILAVAPEFPDTYYYLGRILEKKLKVKEAIAAYDEALRLDARMHKASDARKILLDKFVGELKRELRVDPNYAEAHTEIGWAFLMRGDMKRAENFLDTALKLDPDLAEALQYKSRIALNRGNVKEAYRLLEKAFQVAPQNLSIFSDFKAVSKKLMENGEGLTVGVDIRPESGEIPDNNGVKNEERLVLYHMERAYWCLENGNIEDARDQLRKVLAIDSDNSEALYTLSAMEEEKQNKESMQALYEEGQQAIRKGDWEKAVEVFNQVLASSYEFERPIEFSFNLAMAYEKSGRFGESLTVYQTLIDQPKRNIEARYRYGMLLYMMNKYSAAKKNLEQISPSDSFFNIHPNELKSLKKALFRIRYRGNSSLILWSGLAVLLSIAVILVSMKYPSWRKMVLFQMVKKAKTDGQWGKVLKLSHSLEKMKLNSTELFSAHLAMAKAFSKKENHKEVVRECKILLAMDPDNRYAHDLLGRAYLSLGMLTPEAAREYMMMLQYEFSNYQLLQIVAEYYLDMEETRPTIFYKKEIYNDRVTDVFRRLLKREPDNPKLLKVMSVIFLEKKKTDSEAIDVFEKVAAQ
ncbi:MAG: tetratricopeptide repeat protein, partial [bacterium]|nr:tetratricopeptide repeat protein [bacterium]